MITKKEHHMKDKKQVRNKNLNMAITETEHKTLKREAKRMKVSMTQLLMTLLNQHVNTTPKA